MDKISYDVLIPARNEELIIKLTIDITGKTTACPNRIL